MEVHFTPEQEAHLQQVANYEGTAPEHLVKNAAVQLLEDDMRFRAAVERGITQANRGEFIERRGNGRAISAHAGILMRTGWTPEAATGLENINQYLRQHRSQFMQPTMRKFYEAAQSLAKMPNRGRVGRREETRESVCSPLPYIIVYRVESEAVEILHIHHAAREQTH